MMKNIILEKKWIYNSSLESQKLLYDAKLINEWKKGFKKQLRKNKFNGHIKKRIKNPKNKW